jgi:hypothetical protein
MRHYLLPSQTYELGPYLCAGNAGHVELLTSDHRVHLPGGSDLHTRTCQAVAAGCV